MATKKQPRKKKAFRKKRTAKKTPAKKKAPARKVPPSKEEDAIAKQLAAKRSDRVIYKGNQRAVSEVAEVIPLGIDVIDYHVLGIGGLPVGRVVEVYSEEGGGKSSLGWSAIASVQDEGGIAALVENEQSVSRERAEVFGATYDDVIIAQPDSLEESLEDIADIAAGISGRRGPNVIVWDSVAAAAPQRVLDGGDPKVGEVAGIMTQRLKQVLKILAHKRICLVCINQVRDNIGVMFGPDLRTPGGRFFKHTASVRLQILGGRKVEDDDNELHIGKDVTVIAAKNRHNAPWRKARVRLMYARGWDNDWSTLDLAKQLGKIKARRNTPKNLQAAREALGFPQ